MSAVEILSPCGGPEALAAALGSGADAVYLGLKNFSARHNAVNFSADGLKEAVRECHKSGVFVYLALNTVLLESELRDASEALKTACEAAVDGIIIQDMAVYEMIKTACPDMPIHASTQMTIHTVYGAAAAKELGFKRVVLARELSLSAIRDICNIGIETEVFAHGALCMCVSGQCYMSAALGGRSANRGLCAGACRLPFSAKARPSDGVHALSLKDLSYCRHVKKLAEAGVTSLKIEGRMKRPEYVAAATDALRRARDGEEYDEKNLRAVFSRSGFTDGYLFGDPDGSMFGARLKEDVTAAGPVLKDIRKIYEKPYKRFKIDLSLSAHYNEPLTLYVDCGHEKVKVCGEIPQKAEGRQTSREEVCDQLSKLGGTEYYPGNINAEIDGGLYIPKSAINALRRKALDDLDARRISSRKPVKFDPSGLIFDFPMPLILKRPELRIRITKIFQLEFLPACETVIPLSEAEKYSESGYPRDLAVIALPRFDFNEKKTAEALKNAKNLGFNAVECSNIGQISLARELGMEIYGGFGLNVTNSLAARHYFFREGVKKLLLSPELTPVQAGCIAVPAKTGMTVYGRLPLMITANCPIRAEVGCGGCKKRLVDRTGAEFPIICRKSEGVFEILNTRPAWLADKLGTLNLDFAELSFTVESPEECREIFGKFREESVPEGSFTRGIRIKG